MHIGVDVRSPRGSNKKIIVQIKVKALNTMMMKENVEVDS